MKRDKTTTHALQRDVGSSVVTHMSAPSACPSGGGLQFPDGVVHQLKRAVHRRCFCASCTMLRCYRAQTMIEHGRRRAQLLALIARQAGPIDVEHVGERGFRPVATGHPNQISLRCREYSNGHELYCYKSTSVRQ